MRGNVAGESRADGEVESLSVSLLLRPDGVYAVSDLMARWRTQKNRTHQLINQALKDGWLHVVSLSPPTYSQTRPQTLPLLDGKWAELKALLEDQGRILKFHELLALCQQVMSASEAKRAPAHLISLGVLLNPVPGRYVLADQWEKLKGHIPKRRPPKAARALWEKRKNAVEWPATLVTLATAWKISTNAANTYASCRHKNGELLYENGWYFLPESPRPDPAVYTPPSRTEMRRKAAEARAYARTREEIREEARLESDQRWQERLQDLPGRVSVLADKWGLRKPLVQRYLSRLSYSGVVEVHAGVYYTVAQALLRRRLASLPGTISQLSERWNLAPEHVHEYLRPLLSNGTVILQGENFMLASQATRSAPSISGPRLHPSIRTVAWPASIKTLQDHWDVREVTTRDRVRRLLNRQIITMIAPDVYDLTEQARSML